MGRVSHVGIHTELEEQLLSFTGGPSEKSPDRLDALVWAMTDLMGYGAWRQADPGLADERAVPWHDRQIPDGAVGRSVFAPSQSPPGSWE